MERISLSNAAFEGNNNAYLFTDGPETVLVDVGDRTDETWTRLEAELRVHGVTPADIDRVLLTHWHGDHSGLAGRIQSRSGAEVRVHSNDAALVEGDDSAWNRMQEKKRVMFEEWEIPPAKREVLFELMTHPDALGSFPTVTPFEDGDVIEFNDHTLEVRHTPGHAHGLCIFAGDLNGRREVFSGDALLPKYTPNIGGADVRVDRPLEKYLRGLRDIVASDFDRAWPGHRDPITDPSHRAEEIIRHHEERARRVLDVLHRLGPCNPWTVSARLFGELEGIHILHGPGESYAHLEHLERTDIVERTGNEYCLTDETAGILECSESEQWDLEY